MTHWGRRWGSRIWTKTRGGGIDTSITLPHRKTSHVEYLQSRGPETNDSKHLDTFPWASYHEFGSQPFRISILFDWWSGLCSGGEPLGFWQRRSLTQGTWHPWTTPKIEFAFARFWVKIYDLPMSMRNLNSRNKWEQDWSLCSGRSNQHLGPLERSKDQSRLWLAETFTSRSRVEIKRHLIVVKDEICQITRFLLRMWLVRARLLPLQTLQPRRSRIRPPIWVLSFSDIDKKEG